MEKVTKAPAEAGETLAAVVIPAVPVAEAMAEILTGMMVLPAVVPTVVRSSQWF